MKYIVGGRVEEWVGEREEDNEGGEEGKGKVTVVN